MLKAASFCRHFRLFAGIIELPRLSAVMAIAMLLATLGMLLDESLPRLNALKQVVSVAANVAAAAFFVGSRLAGSGSAGAGHIHWPVTVAMAAGGLAGGFVGGRLASRTNPAALRRLMVALGLVLLFISDWQLNTDLIKGLPYFGTLVVLAVFSRRMRPPAAAGQPWRKGQIT